MAPSLKTSGTWAEYTADGSVTIPGSPSAGNRMFLFATWKPYDTTVTVSGWTAIGSEFADGTTGNGNGSGSVKVMAWYRDWQSGDGNPTFDLSATPANNIARAVIELWQKDATEQWDTPTDVTAAIASATNWSATSSSTLTVKNGAVIFELVGVCDDSAVMTRSATTALNDDGSPTVTWNGNYVESPATHGSSTTGFDSAADLGHRFVTTGTTGVNLTGTGTFSGARTGSVKWVHQGVTVATNATADLASGTGAAQAGADSIATSAAVSTATGAAQATIDDIGATGALSTSTGDAYGMTATVEWSIGLATSTGAVAQLTDSVETNATLGTSTGAALDATAEGDAGTITFNADVATATFAAIANSMSISATLGYARGRSS